jgi:hypothetical protein
MSALTVRTYDSTLPLSSTGTLPPIFKCDRTRGSFHSSLLLCYVMVSLLHTHQRRKQLGVVASCDINQWEARSCH